MIWNSLICLWFFFVFKIVSYLRILNGLSGILLVNRLLLRLNYPCIFNILLSASDDYQILRVTAVNLADWGIILQVIFNIVALLKSLSFLRWGAALILSKHKIIPYFIILLIFSKNVLGGVGWYHMTYLFRRSSVRSVIGFIWFLIVYFSINVIRCLLF